MHSLDCEESYVKHKFLDREILSAAFISIRQWAKLVWSKAKLSLKLIKKQCQWLILLESDTREDYDIRRATLDIIELWLLLMHVVLLWNVIDNEILQLYFPNIGRCSVSMYEKELKNYYCVYTRDESINW